jgi:uncharacterized membrane protein YbhN (UPF0104 family)
VLLLVATILPLVALPHLVGATWHDITQTMTAVSPWWLPALSAVWLAGLCLHTLVLTASLSGLSSRQALSLNLAGSAVANSVPLGGPMSMGLTTTMARSWGFEPAALGAFLTVSNLWNIAARVLIGAAAVGWLTFADPGGVHRGILLGLVVPLVMAAVLAFAILGGARTSVLAGRLAGRVWDQVDARRHRPYGSRRDRFGAAVAQVRRLSIDVAVRAWRRLSLGMLGYLLLLAVLLDMCCRAVGGAQAVPVILAAVGVERLLTAVPVTPGGAAVAELGLGGVLTTAGKDPLLAVAAALLYRLFTFALEIPVGLGVSVGWVVGRRLHSRPAASGSAAS